MAVLLILILFAVVLLVGSVAVIGVNRRRTRRVAPYVEPPAVRRPPEAPNSILCRRGHRPRSRPVRAANW